MQLKGKTKTHTLKSIFIIALALLTPIKTQAREMNSAEKNSIGLNSTRQESIDVPEVKGKQIITDGMFDQGEWEDAFRYSVSENYDLYFMADTEILYVGLKSAKPIGELVCEVRITSDDKQVFLPHVSGALGEGVSGFPSTTKFDLNNNQYWEANFLKPDPLKQKAWIAAGKPIENYDDVYNKREGVEFKIYRKKFTGSTLKFTIGWVRVEMEGKKPQKNTFNYPENAGLQNSDNWIELNFFHDPNEKYNPVKHL